MIVHLFVFPMPRSLFLVILFSCCCNILLAQDTLPKVSVINSSNHIVISWINPYTSLTTINIQRSQDSLKNFKTIGGVLDIQTKANGFVDAKPPQTNFFYRLFLSYEGGMYIFTKSFRPVIDTSKTLPKDFKTVVVSTFFEPSKFIFTGRENNVIISLPQAGKKKYMVKFFEENGTFLFDISRIAEPYLTLDKVNFVHAGLFSFELYEDGILLEKQRFYIPKDGKSGQQGEQGKYR